MADINIHTAAFVSHDLLFDGTETLSTEWATHLANNTGYVAGRPISVWHHHLGIMRDAKVSTWQGVSDMVFLAAGTWTLYYSMAGTVGSNYIGYVDNNFFPDLYLDGSKCVAGYGTWVSQSGSFSWVSSGQPISIELRPGDAAADADRIAGYVSLFGMRDEGSLV